ncbi:hypothetical protein QG37_03800 [Candidozyma auris]|nr:hypothetical protein QG37_03800 [[Candida] auris]
MVNFKPQKYMSVRRARAFFRYYQAGLMFKTASFHIWNGYICLKSTSLSYQTECLTPHSQIHSQDYILSDPDSDGNPTMQEVYKLI